MEVPHLSILQILILDTIGASEVSGVELREKLKKGGFRKSRPAFYQAMDRLIAAGLVKSRYTVDQLHGHTVREKHFRMTGCGAKAMLQAQKFFENLSWEVVYV